MNSFLKSTILAAIASVAPVAAQASTYHVVVNGTLTKDSGSPTVFGLPNISIPISTAFDLDSSLGSLLPAGTTFNGLGNNFATDVIKFTQSGISNFSMQIGTGVWNQNNLIHQTLGSTGGSYDIFIAGSSLDSILGISFVLRDGGSFGDVYFGAFSCPAQTCSVLPIGSVFSYQDSGAGDISNISVTATPVAGVPEPATWAMMIVGFGLIGSAMRRRQSVRVTYA